MNFSEEYLQIQTSEVDSIGGAKPEPEERPMRRVLVAADGIKMSMTNGLKPSDVSRDAKDSVPGIVSAHTDVGTLTSRLRLCGACKHFDQKWWRDALARMKLSDDPADRQFVQTIYAEFSMTTNPNLIEMHQGDDDDGVDTEHAIQSHGLCQAYTHILHELGYSDFDSQTIVHPLGSCPDVNMKTSPPSPWPVAGPMYSPASPEHERAMEKIRDEILLKSEGKLR